MKHIGLNHRIVCLKSVSIQAHSYLRRKRHVRCSFPPLRSQVGILYQVELCARLGQPLFLLGGVLVTAHRIFVQ
jgi:hypothetical protein